MSSDWVDEIECEDSEARGIIGGVTDDIDDLDFNRWLCRNGMHHSVETNLSRCDSYDSIEELHEEAGLIESERDEAFDGLRLCETVIDDLKDAVEKLVRRIDQYEEAMSAIREATEDV